MQPGQPDVVHLPRRVDRLGRLLRTREGSVAGEEPEEVRWRRLMVRRTALIAAGLLLIAGCSSGQQSAQNRQGQAGFVSGTGNVSVFAAADRKAAPVLSGKTLDDKTWTLSDH